MDSCIELISDFFLYVFPSVCAVTVRSVVSLLAIAQVIIFGFINSKTKRGKNWLSLDEPSFNDLLVCTVTKRLKITETIKAFHFACIDIHFFSFKGRRSRLQNADISSHITPTPSTSSFFTPYVF